ncbi:MAG: hypothetical protein WBA93_10055 [Microcoleaceae cyanobacterium]
MNELTSQFAGGAVSIPSQFAGVWLYEGKPGPVISVSEANVTIDMSAYNRPTATGKIVSDTEISVTFPDDNTFTGKLVDNQIKWSNGRFWNRSQFAGVWLYEGKPGPVISVSEANVTIDMSAYNRPTATGKIVSDTEISVTFPDDNTFTGKLVDNQIKWSNGTFWTRSKDKFSHDSASLNSVLLEGGWRNQRDLATMSDDDKRNTLIVELDLGSAENIPYLQSLDNNELIGSAALYIWLRDKKIRTKEELSKMSLGDQRNTVIVEINVRSKSSISIPDLQGMNNNKLADILVRF